MNFVESELKLFIEHLNKIIDCINKTCNDLSGEKDKLLIINRLHMYAQEFFVKNELAFKSKSSELQSVKLEHKEFFNGLKNIQNIENPDAKILVELKKYLESWIEKNLENVI